MKSKSFGGMACSIAGVLEAIGDRWAVLILRDLSLGLARYEDLRRSTGVTNATLSDRLKHLEDNELIERQRYQVNPERYEYVLTRKGRDTILLLQALAQVGDKWAVSGNAGPPLEFVNRKTGNATAATNASTARLNTRLMEKATRPGGSTPDPAAATFRARRSLSPRNLSRSPTASCSTSSSSKTTAATIRTITRTTISVAGGLV